MFWYLSYVLFLLTLVMGFVQVYIWVKADDRRRLEQAGYPAIAAGTYNHPIRSLWIWQAPSWHFAGWHVLA